MAFRDAVTAGFPGARISWAFSWLALQEATDDYKKIRELEKKLKRLEQEKEVLNRAIDIADSQFKTDIRKKYLSLLSEATEQAQSENGAPLDL